MRWIPLIEACTRVRFGRRLRWHGWRLRDTELNEDIVPAEGITEREVIDEILGGCAQITAAAAQGEITLRGYSSAGEVREISENEARSFNHYTFEFKGADLTDTLRDKGGNYFCDVEVSLADFLLKFPLPTPTAAAEKRCEEWLRERFGAGDPRKKQALRAEAVDTMEHLGKRAFNRAWDAATKDFPNRSKAGAPKKARASK